MDRSVVLALALSSIGCNQVFGIAPLGPCRDEDGDGYDTCLPDCDDTNAAVRPDQPEICGNALDDDCDGAPDQYCLGLGTFVSELLGNDANPGTQELPVETVNEALAHAQQIGHGVDVYVGEGFYLEDVTLVEGVSFFGAYTCNPSAGCTWQERDFEKIPSCILAQDANGMLADASITRDTVLDGMCIDGGLGFELGGMQAAALTIDGGSPILRDTFLNGAFDDLGGATKLPCESGYAVEIVAPGAVPPLFDNVFAQGGSCEQGTTAAIEVRGGGAIELRDSDVVGGFSRVALGMRVREGGRASIEQSALEGGWCVAPEVISGGQNFALGTDGASEIYVDRSLLNSFLTICNCGDEDFTPSNDPWCAAVNIADTGKLTFTNNVVYGLFASRSAAMLVAASGDTDAVINGNVFNAAPVEGAEPMMPPFEVAALVIEAVGGDYAAGRYRNNVLRGGLAGPMNRYGVFEAGEGVHPRVEALSHNNLVEVDIAYRSWNGTTAQLLTGVPDLVALSFANDNFNDDCQLDPAFHLVAGSPCIDRGTSEEAPDHDFEGEPRPNGAAVDVGADEFRAR